MRCGFVAGDPDLIAHFQHLRSYGGAQVPLPIQEAATALWQRRGACRGQPRALSPQIRHRRGACSAAGSASTGRPAGSSCGSMSATARRRPCGCGATRRCGSLPGAYIGARERARRSIPASAIFASRSSMTRPRDRARGIARVLLRVLRVRRGHGQHRSSDGCKGTPQRRCRTARPLRRSRAGRGVGARCCSWSARAAARASALADLQPRRPLLEPAVDAPPSNISRPRRRAAFADLLVQSFGLAAWLLPVMLLDWSVRLLLGRGLAAAVARGCCCCLPALRLLALALAVLPAPRGWPAACRARRLSLGKLLRRALAGAPALPAPLAAMAAAALAGLAAALRHAASSRDRLAQRTLPAERPQRPRRRRRRRPRAAWRRALLRGVARRGCAARHPRRAQARASGASRSSDAGRRGGASAGTTDGREDRRAAVPRRSMCRRAAPSAPSRRASRRSISAPTSSRCCRRSTCWTKPPPPPRPPRSTRRRCSRTRGCSKRVLEDFGVRGQIVKIRPGPVVTLYELEPAPGIKASRVIGLADDIARSMSAISVRVAVVPGPQRDRHRAAEPQGRDGVSARAAGVRAYEQHPAPARPGARQGHRRRAGHRRPRAHAASADRRHHRLGQVGRHQHDDPVDALPAAARPVPIHHDRSEDAGAVGL